MLIEVKIVPGASRTRLLGEWNGRVRIAVAAPPEKGKANQAVVEFLAESLGLRKKDVTVIAGQTNPMKTIRIDRATIGAVCALLSAGQS